MKFSICIPNYNYAAYIGRTIESVLAQECQDFEISISDNASTDTSLDVIKSYHDPRINVRVNACNVGFAGNLDRAAARTSGQWMNMLSSDDLMRPEALSTYKRLIDHLGSSADRVLICSSSDMIDPEDHIIGRVGPEPAIWTSDLRAPELDTVVGAPVYRVAGPELLRRALLVFKNPLSFLATIYPRQLYDEVEGYGGNRCIVPDKWFHWKLLSVASEAYFIDLPLFAYRWHPSNQAAQQNSAGNLKLIVDGYLSTLEFDDARLKLAGITRDDCIRSYIETDIARHGLATLARGGRIRAKRILQFGAAVYPKTVRGNRKAWALWTLLKLGPLGTCIAGWAYRRCQSANRDRAEKY